MKAMIFAAGYGTRLKPLTNMLPKALVPLRGKPMLQHTLEYIYSFGFDEVIINVHHYAAKVREFIADYNTTMRITVSDESENLLDTGGGLKHASWFFDDHEPFLLINTDLLTNIDLKDMLEQHKRQDAMVTLAVRKDYRSRFLLMDNHMRLYGKGDEDTGRMLLVKETNQELSRYRFAGIHIINPDIFSHFPTEDRFPVMDWYLKVAEHAAIKGYDFSDGLWMDLGRPENLVAAESLYDRFFT